MSAALALLMLYFVAVSFKPEINSLLATPTWIFGLLFLGAEIVHNAGSLARLEKENKHEEAMARLSIDEEADEQLTEM